MRQHRFSQDVLANGGDYETSAPARPAGFVSDVAVPLVQSTITAALVASLLVFVASRVWHLDDLGAVWLGAFLVVLLVAWLVLLGQHRQLLWQVETWIGADLDNSGEIGQPRDRLVFLGRERAKQETERERKHGAWLQFLSFVQGIPLRGTTLRAWEGQGVSRADYVTWRTALIDYGLARFKVYREDGSPVETHGWELTKSVDDIMDRLSID